MEAPLETLNVWAGNFQRNIGSTFSGLSLQGYVRLIAIVGAYCLLRPYLLKLAAKFQARDHERELDPDEMSSAKAALSPNSLRGQVAPQLPEDTDDEDDESDEEGLRYRAGSGVDWGKNARRKQRRMIKQLLEADEKRRLEDEEAESDKDIEEFLEK
ncbi:MAG: hypothetical protein M4579_004593 [Chaenotheca gracillima]|nr:MAG: hypothetical protein M4579_004593 [Chaenotheca gracillima]